MPYIKDNLPYNVPYQIYMDPSNLCNFKCAFCPTGNKHLLKSVGRPAGRMKAQTFEKFFKDLRFMIEKYREKPASINLFKDGEPLLNPDLPKMIRTLSINNFSDILHLTTNGSLLTEELSNKIIKAGLKEIRFSIYGIDDSTYQKHVNRRISFEKVKNNVKNFWKINKSLGSPVNIICQMVNTYSDSEINKFRTVFEKICHVLNITQLHKWSDSEDWEMRGLRKDLPTDTNSFICAQPFSRLTVLFNGDVTPCCVDWSHKLVIGNINKNSLDHIWNVLGNKIRHQHIAGEFDSGSPCTNCDYMHRVTKYDKIYNDDNFLNKIYKY